MGLAHVRDNELDAIKMRMIEVPESGIGKRGRNVQRMCGVRRNRKRACVRIGEGFEAVFLVDNAKRHVAAPIPGTSVSAMRGNRKLSLRVVGIRKGIDVELFDKHFGCDEELHRAENAAVVREVAGASAREHVKVEGIVHTNDERIRRFRVNEMRNVESKSGVAFARMFASELAVDPDRRGMKYSGKLNSDGGAGPAFRNGEAALIPGDAAILGERRLNLPGVGNSDGDPILCGGLCCEPIVAQAHIFWIGAEEPFSVEAG